MGMGPEAERAARLEVWEMLKGGATADEVVESFVASGWSEESAYDITVRSVTSRWNWGGFWLPGFWLLGNRCWLAFGGMALATGFLFSVVWRIAESIAGEEPLSAHAEDLLTAAMRVFMLIWHLVAGYMGGRWSWRARKYESIQQFRETQNVWADWGWVLGVLTILSIIMQGTFTGWRRTLAEHFLH